MQALDVEALTGEIAAEAPSGPNLEYDPAYLELERAAQGRQETQVGDHITPAEPPDWLDVRARCLALLGRTRDLRVAVTMARALLELDGVAGFADALRLIESLVRARWADVHPQLDPDDDDDPTSRVNALLALTDGATFVRAFRAAPLARSRVLGLVTLRDLEIAAGEARAADGAEPPTTASIDAVFQDTVLADLQRDAEQLAAALGSLRGIESTLTERVGAARAVDFAPLSRLVKRASDVVGAHAARRAPNQDAGAPDGGIAGAAAASASTPAGEIASRDDVIRMIDRLCEYYQRHEPASPVPLMLLRARRLVSMTFLEAIEELAPDGLPQVRVIGGIPPP